MSLDEVLPVGSELIMITGEHLTLLKQEGVILTCEDSSKQIRLSVVHNVEAIRSGL